MNTAMKRMNTDIKTVDEYISMFNDEVQALLQQVRAVITTHSPGATEGIAYGMPAYKMGGKPLVYFAAFKKHIGFYATPTGHEAFKAELAPYKQGRGSVQFPLNQPMPFDLIKQIVLFRVEQQTEKAAQ
ncbi:iron chaperone [Pseudocnuella soli]|uniref:iron chaperone n=1 Tax=Pseudocnuella soli TaxID=2502779 RepID=UPI001F00FA36|nr:DUF1801 domain-containing protein [Pseudocnuella soli]